MSNFLIGFVGDMLVNRDQPQEAFKDVRELLREPQIMFGNLEGVYTDHPHPSPGAYIAVGAPAHNLDVYADVGFNVLSMASNHVLDMGYTALLETRSRLRSQGVKTCGVGASIVDAREPALLDAAGVGVAFLAYASCFPIGYEARSNVPGLAPMRAYKFWRDSDPGSYPGGDAVSTLVSDQNDMNCLAEDIRRARERSDVVIVSFHWGEYSRPFHLTEHERRIARYSIDNGADMVVGHHHHALRGMEWYNGKPIMYGLGHFVFDLRWQLSAEVQKLLLSPAEGETSYGVGPREGWPLLPLHKDTRMTVMAWASASSRGISEIGFVPCHLTADGLVHPLHVDSPESNDLVAYLTKCIHTQGLRGMLSAENSRTLAGFRTLQVLPA